MSVENCHTKYIKSITIVENYLMANIEISDLNISGIELFNDSESFLDQIQDTMSSSIHGGELTPIPFPTYTVAVDDRTITLIPTGPPQSIDCLPPVG